jgi:predicted phosphoribosyltransferase
LLERDTDAFVPSTTRAAVGSYDNDLAQLSGEEVFALLAKACTHLERHP